MKRVQMSGLRAYVLLGAAVGWFLSRRIRFPFFSLDS